MPVVEEPELSPNKSSLESPGGHEADTEGSSTLAHGQDEASPIESDGRVMRDTLTDVQKAIEQLGRGPGPMDSRSFSFTSSRDEYSETEAESEFDPDAEESLDEGTDWHKDARQKLAEKARKAASRKERESRALSGAVRLVSPPIDVEVSDESEDEGEEVHPGHRHHIMSSSPSDDRPPPVQYGSRAYSDIQEESEDEGQPARGILKTGDTPEPTATATRTTFPTIYPPPTASASAAQRSSTIYPEIDQLPSSSSSSTAGPAALPTPITPETRLTEMASVPSQGTTSTIAPQTESPSPVNTPSPLLVHVRDYVPHGLPSPAASAASNVMQLQQSFASSVADTPQMTPSASMASRASTHPTEWSVEEVIDWLKSKGFDQGVCDKFIGKSVTIPP